MTPLATLLLLAFHPPVTWQAHRPPAIHDVYGARLGQYTLPRGGSAQLLRVECTVKGVCEGARTHADAYAGAACAGRIGTAPLGCPVDNRGYSVHTITLGKRWARITFDLPTGAVLEVLTVDRSVAEGSLYGFLVPGPRADLAEFVARTKAFTK